MFAVDTNILVHAADLQSPWNRPCRDALERWRAGNGAWFSTWGVLYEYLRVVTHRRILREPLAPRSAWKTVEALLESPGFHLLVPTPRHAAVAAEVLAEVPDVAGNLVHDAHTAILMREHGIRRIYTRDVDFHHFPFLEVVDPTRPEPRAGERVARYRSRSGKRASAPRGATLRGVAPRRTRKAPPSP